MQFEPGSIDAAFYDRLREHYTEEEIVELGAFIGFNVGYHTFFRTLDFAARIEDEDAFVGHDEADIGDVKGDRCPDMCAELDEARSLIRLGIGGEFRVDTGLGSRDGLERWIRAPGDDEHKGCCRAQASDARGHFDAANRALRSS